MSRNGTNVGNFKINFLFILALGAKVNRILILKTPTFVPFDGNLALLEAKSDVSEYAK